MSGRRTSKRKAGHASAAPTSTAPPQATLNANQTNIAAVPAILIVTGVAGSGKTTIATALAEQLDWPFEEGDQLHPASDAIKMHSSHPLDDHEQWPWLEKVAVWIDGWRQAGKSGVMTCSALKRSYRDFLTSGRPEVRVVYLHGEKAVIATRLAARKGYFMQTRLLDSHFAILEEPDPDEDSIRVEADRPKEDIVAEIRARVRPTRAGEVNRLSSARNRIERPAVTPTKPDVQPTPASVGPLPGGADVLEIRSSVGH